MTFKHSFHQGNNLFLGHSHTQQFQKFSFTRKTAQPFTKQHTSPRSPPAAVIALHAPTYPTELHLTHSTPQEKKDLLITLPATL